MFLLDTILLMVDIFGNNITTTVKRKYPQTQIHIERKKKARKTHKGGKHRSKEKKRKEKD